MDFGINHMLGRINNNFSISYCTFQMAGCAMGTVKIHPGYVMRPFGELAYDRTDAVVVIDKVGEFVGFILRETVTRHAVTVAGERRAEGVVWVVAEAAIARTAGSR
jgi:hypothetical protein